jgi:DNA repair exonuclease SbcCD nuclease subunit
MTALNFLHAADLHLDSPLLGLAAKSADYAVRIEEASRQAFQNLVDLALEADCKFVVLSGDIFDGHLRNFPTGLFFLTGLRRLGEAGVRVFIVLGNHDAENRFASKLHWSDNVHLFSSRRPETIVLEDLRVAVHGRSFWQRDVSENIALDYPQAKAGLFNIGLLHTACQGFEGPHAAYAPCSVQQLVNHGYDYWALGHVHSHAVLNEHPHVVYPGNLQGRHPREAGPKGAVVVTVDDGRITSVEHRELDVVRWANEPVDVGRARSREEILDIARTALESIVDDAGDRPIALRLRLTGETDQHGDLALNLPDYRQDLETMLATLAGEVWLEKLELATTAPPVREELDPTIAGRLMSELAAMTADASLAAQLEARLTAIRTRMPAGARPDELFEQIRATGIAQASDLALSLVADVERADAVR